MAKLKETPYSERPREKLIQKGAEKLTDAELLAIILRTGREGENVLDISKKILRKFPKKELIDVSLESLSEIPGLNTAKAATLKAAFELSKRSFSVFDTDLPVIQRAEKVTEQISHIRAAKREHFITLFLNARSQLLAKETIFTGTVNAVNIHPREVFEPALHHGATTVIVAHNHPSGDVQPSKDDKHVTSQLKEAGSLIGIELADHVIVAKQGYFSFREEGEL